MKVYFSTDHDGHWPVGSASVVVAPNESEARKLLKTALEEDGLDNNHFSLTELDTTQPAAKILVNGEY